VKLALSSSSSLTHLIISEHLMYIPKAHNTQSLREAVAVLYITLLSWDNGRRCRPAPPDRRFPDVLDIYFVQMISHLRYLIPESCLPFYMGALLWSQSHPESRIKTNRRALRIRWSSASQNQTRITHLTGVLQKNGTLYSNLTFDLIIISIMKGDNYDGGALCVL
jgi:hypothetical protein